MSIDMTRKLPRPPGHHVVTPSFAAKSSGALIDFLQRAFGGEVVDRYDGPNGAVYHAEVRVGDSVIMFGDATPELEAMPAGLSLYVDTGESVDSTYQRALAAGATSLSEPTNEFYGYRRACVRDVSGNRWTICAVVEELTREEIDKRMANMKP